MKINVLETSEACGRAAAEKAAEILRRKLAEQPTVRFIAATGASQFHFLEALTSAPGIDWSRTVMFHLDEYVGVDDQHPASFRRYLRERLASKVNPSKVHYLNADAPDPKAECARVGKLLQEAPIDVAFVGIGENGHLAFNDPPADFETKEPYLVVALDDACRKQQLGEGWFPTFDDVPMHAISMSISAIMQVREIVCTVPDGRKAQAVADCLSDKAAVSNLCPASILKTHPNVTVFLDRDSAALLNK